jgi:site-specific DNA-methyltransferase (adenine-specific)
MSGVIIGTGWTDIPSMHSQAHERLGYPTPKPEALLARVIKARSNEGDRVLDPFCGCGTALAVAERRNRRWKGIDITHLALALMKNRLQSTFKADLALYEVLGAPKDLASPESPGTAGSLPV